MEVVTGVASSVVEKILVYPVRLIGRHLGYLIYYQTNKNRLVNRVLELDSKISSVQRRAQAAQRNGEELEGYVTRWIGEAERNVQEAKDVIYDRGHENAKFSCNGSFPNLVLRYKLSKKAKIMADNIVIDFQKAHNFGNFSYRPLIQPSFKNKDYEAFDSRKQTLKEIMEALRDPNLTMIGVYGMGGIGKTTLVTEVARQAKEEECFSALVMVTVSQNFDLEKIQKRIAEGLGLKLSEEDMSARANRLQHRLRQGNKILIILDDVWNEFDLSKAGIYFSADDQRGCKILLVSRDQEVLCNRMRVRKNIEVKVLFDSESMSLFEKYVGDKPDDPDLVNQVVRECGGLPIAIATIACSLEKKSLLVWKDILLKLKKSPRCGMYGRVYSCIKASYDFLESEEEKKLLLLCSLHGEDADVRVNDLMIYGIGWDLFQEVDTMEEARCRVHSLVHKLKASCLLLNGDYEGRVEMHDVIRDVMISIAKEDEHMHRLTRVSELEDGDFRESKAIILLGPDFNDQLLPRLACPTLQLLLAFDRNDYLSLGTVPDDFFNEAQELKALSFDYPLQSLPKSFRTLRHLRALRLPLHNQEDISLIGELRNLIILDLSGSTFIQLPEHIGKLTRLRLLNLSDCYRLRVIQPNVISSLVRLEELYMDQVNTASLMELNNLQHLTTLHLNVRDANVLPEEERHVVFNEVLCPKLKVLTTSWSELIKEMCNCQSSRAPPFCNLKVVDLKCSRNEPIGLSLKCIQRYQNLESLSLSGFFVDTTHHYQQLMVSSEEHERPLKCLKKLRLFQLSMLTHLYEDSEDSENISLKSLKLLHIQECDKLKSPLLSSTTSFQNLTALVVSKCSAMMKLLASSTAKTLVHLRLMSITECKQMTEIIADEIVDDEIVFDKLEILELSDLPSLRSFHLAENGVMRFPNLVMLVVSQCPEMRRFSFGTIDAPKLDCIISEIKKEKYRWDYWFSGSNFDYRMLRLPEPNQKLWEGDINKTLEKLWEKDDDSLVVH